MSDHKPRKQPALFPVDPANPPVAVIEAEVGTRAWYEAQLDDVRDHLREAKPGEAAALHRRMMQYAEKITELRDAERPADTLDEGQLLDRMASEARSMADAYLEVFVREYVARNRLALVRAS
jgi:hypothetical protein